MIKCIAIDDEPLALQQLVTYISKIPFRVAIPKRVIKPMMDGMLITPEVKNTARTPPINASGRLSKTMAERVRSLNSPYSSKKMTQTARSDAINNVRVAFAAVSNCPPYSIL